MNPANIEGLVGRKFVSSRGHVCRMERLGPGAVRAVWADKRSEITEAEYDELNKWAEKILGGALNVTDHRDPKTEAEAYRKWKEK